MDVGINVATKEYIALSLYLKAKLDKIFLNVSFKNIFKPSKIKNKKYLYQ